MNEPGIMAHILTYPTKMAVGVEKTIKGRMSGAVLSFIVLNKDSLPEDKPENRGGNE